jgi:hypothetical protein
MVTLEPGSLSCHVHGGILVLVDTYKFREIQEIDLHSAHDVACLEEIHEFLLRG